MAQESKQGRIDKSQFIVTPHTLVLSLSEEQQYKARECLAKTGEITFKFKEISVTKLPELLDNGVLID